jgi:signal transduction histidine kinase
VNVDDTGAVRIAVADTGIGIAQEDIPRTLEPFQQAANAHARDHGGAGLGLALTRKFIDLHGGRIEIDSTLGVGTTVTLHLPTWRHQSLHEEAKAIA